MKFSAKEDISAPIEQVFDAIADFDSVERAVLRRGIDVTRLDDLNSPGVGMSWDASFDFKGKPRQVSATISQFKRPEVIVMSTDSGGLQGVATVELVSLNPRTTRMAVAVELSPTNLTSRLFLQSLRLAKANLTKRFKKGVHRYAETIQSRIGTAV